MVKKSTTFKKNVQMKKTVLILIVALTIGLYSKAQTTRYFEFTTNCGHGNWQDSTFIASTSDLVVIDTVLANIARPLNQRGFISGDIIYGNGGHNHNASHWYLWHFIPNQWNIVEVAIGDCDGCPYTDLDADTSYWVGNIGHFCPWSGNPVREVSNPLGIYDPIFENQIFLHPNPAQNILNLKWNSTNNIKVIIYNSVGKELSTVLLSKQNATINITNLPNGIYFLQIIDNNKIGVKKLVIDGK